MRFRKPTSRESRLSGRKSSKTLVKSEKSFCQVSSINCFLFREPNRPATRNIISRHYRTVLMIKTVHRLNCDEESGIIMRPPMEALLRFITIENKFGGFYDNFRFNLAGKSSWTISGSILISDLSEISSTFTAKTKLLRTFETFLPMAKCKVT